MKRLLAPFVGLVMLIALTGMQPAADEPTTPPAASPSALPAEPEPATDEPETAQTGDYLLLGYTVAIILLWGYASLLWGESRQIRRRERSRLAMNDEQS